MLPTGQGGEVWSVEALMGWILETAASSGGIEGVTLLGGEPFAQAEPCADLCERARRHGLGVMLFTGYAREELAAGSDPAWPRLLAATDLLVDGRYRRDRPDRRRRWIGSTNQRLWFQSDRYRADDPRFAEPDSVELRFHPDSGLQVNGWPELAAQLEPSANR